MNTLCRTCLQEIEHSSDTYNLDAVEPNLAELTLGQKLAACVPELVLDATNNAVLCWSCTTALRCAYGFRQQCLESESRIKTYLQKTASTSLGDLRRITEEEEVIFVDVVECSSGDDAELNVVDVESDLSNSEVSKSVSEAATARTSQSGPSGNRAAKTDELYKSPWPHLLKELLNDKPYQCSLCSYKTVKISKYEVHKRLHSLQQLSCSWCAFSCANETDLADHMRIHGMENHKCNRCNYETPVGENIATHIKIHQSKASCECSQCNLPQQRTKRKKI